MGPVPGTSGGPVRPEPTGRPPPRATSLSWSRYCCAVTPATGSASTTSARRTIRSNVPNLVSSSCRSSWPSTPSRPGTSSHRSGRWRSSCRSSCSSTSRTNSCNTTRMSPNSWLIAPGSSIAMSVWAHTSICCSMSRMSASVAGPVSTSRAGGSSALRLRPGRTSRSTVGSPSIGRSMMGPVSMSGRPATTVCSTASYTGARVDAMLESRSRASRYSHRDPPVIGIMIGYDHSCDPTCWLTVARAAAARPATPAGSNSGRGWSLQSVAVRSDTRRGWGLLDSTLATRSRAAASASAGVAPSESVASWSRTGTEATAWRHSSLSKATTSTIRWATSELGATDERGITGRMP